MDSNLVTPPDIVNNGLHSVIFVDPDHADVDAIVRFCQWSEQAYNIYVYTPNMENLSWLEDAVQACDAVIVNARSSDYNHICLLDKSYYYGPRLYVENSRKLNDPIHYFAKQLESAK